MESEKLIKICEQVENDAKEFDGSVFDGKTIITYLGYHSAAIKALADVLKETIVKMSASPE